MKNNQNHTCSECDFFKSEKTNIEGFSACELDEGLRKSDWPACAAFQPTDCPNGCGRRSHDDRYMDDLAF